jgi:hypothetical protein
MAKFIDDHDERLADLGDREAGSHHSIGADSHRN